MNSSGLQIHYVRPKRQSKTTFLRHNLSLTPRPGNCRTEIFPMICQSLRGKRSCNTGGSRLNKMIPIRKRYVISIYSKKPRFLNHVRPISVKWEKLQRLPHLAPFARPHCQCFLDEHSNHPTARTTPNTRDYNLTIQNTQLISSQILQIMNDYDIPPSFFQKHSLNTFFPITENKRPWKHPTQTSSQQLSLPFRSFPVPFRALTI